MKQNLYSIFDVIAEEYGPIFHAKNDAVANRNYLRMLTGENISEEEYKIVRLGDFDTESGYINYNKVRLEDVVIEEDIRDEGI